MEGTGMDQHVVVAATLGRDARRGGKAERGGGGGGIALS